MTVLLVLALFAALIGTDLAVQRWTRWRAAAVQRKGAGDCAATEMVAGYSLAPDVSYHPLHMWARVIDPVTVAVGIDDFAARLLGRVSGLVLPAVGRRIGQGKPSFLVRGKGREARLAAPIGGTVVAVNKELDGAPALCRQSPYGRGWLCQVRVPDAEASVRSLRRNGAARTWLRRERDRLIEGVSLSGCALPDGGELVPDFASRIDRKAWQHLVDTFLSAEPESRATERESER